ncbi:F-box domain containing protein [Tanacetum coccineum]
MMDIRLASPPNLPKFHFPNTFLSASSLTYLILHKCELPSSLMVGVVKLKSLRLLTPSCLRLNEGVIKYLTKGCPLLEEIYLANCYGFKTFCVKRHQNLLKVKIGCDSTFLPEIIDIEAPNLSYFSLISHKDKAPSMFLDSCKKLTTFCYRGFPLTRFNDFLSKFQFLENVALDLSSHVNNLKFSNQSLKKIRLRSQCDLDEIDLNAPNLLFFEYCDQVYFHDFTPLSREDSYLSKGCMMKCETPDCCDILWFKKLREFLEKNSIFKVLKLAVNWELTNVEELKLIQSPPYKLEHVELKSRSLRKSPVYVALLDVVLWCFRPRSLTINLGDSINKSDVVKFAYEKLLQQEGEGQTRIKFVLIYDFVNEQQFSGLNSLLKALSLGRSRCKITFIKEEGGANSSGVMVLVLMGEFMHDDICEQVLEILGVKDLIRCNIVCKLWKSLISHPRFVKAHHTRQVNLVPRYKAIIQYQLFKYGPKYYMVGSSNGLAYINSFDGDEIIVANPSTREERILKKLPVYHPLQSCWGFGYHALTDDYKVVFGASDGLEKTAFQVLSLKSNVWKHVGHVNYTGFGVVQIGPLCNGELQWVMYSGYEQRLISFDLSKECKIVLENTWRNFYTLGGIESKEPYAFIPTTVMPSLISPHLQEGNE